ncbi:hypothetical protein RQP46_004315 [Phenoliferia psychrophenolica]
MAHPHPLQQGAHHVQLAAGPSGQPGQGVGFDYGDWVHTQPAPTVGHAVASIAPQAIPYPAHGGGNGGGAGAPRRYSPYGVAALDTRTPLLGDALLQPSQPSPRNDQYPDYRLAAQQQQQQQSAQLPLLSAAAYPGSSSSSSSAPFLPASAVPLTLPQSQSSSRPVATKPRRSAQLPPPPGPLATPAPAPAAPTSSGAAASGSLPRKSPRTPQPAPEESSVPEAALHLLRLALPSGSNGSASTTTRGDDDASCDEDAEGESDATSVHSDDDSSRRPHQKGTGRRTTSVASSRGHRPARTQREMSTSTRAGSEGPRDGSANGSASASRRTSGRVRKTIVGDTKKLFAGDDSDDDDRPYKDEDDDDEDAGGAGGAGGGRGAEDEEAYVDHQRAPSVASASPAVKGKGKAAPPSAKAKRPSLTPATAGDGSAPPAKKARSSTSSTSTPTVRRPRRVAAPAPTTQRTFPASVELAFAAFPRLYRSFPVSSAFGPESYVNRLRSVSHDLNHASFPGNAGEVKLPEIRETGAVTFMQPPEGAKWNKACDPFNLYAPRFTRGTADEKAGMCPVCVEPVERGGEGTERWLKLKNSSYVYHMSYAHGLSNLTGLPFSPPLKTRTQHLKPLTKDARDHMTEGLCHRCNNWIPLLSVKNVEAVVPELIWWKHAKPCHGNSAIQGEGDYYVQDAVYDLVVSRKTANNNNHGNGNGNGNNGGVPQPQQQQQQQQQPHANVHPAIANAVASTSGTIHNHQQQA